MADILQLSYESKLEEVSDKLEPHIDNYAQVFRNVTRGKVQKFSFELVSMEEVRKKIKQLPNKKSMRIDDISYLMVQVLGDSLVEPLMRIVILEGNPEENPCHPELR